jgi:hypothetical protein
MSSTRHASRPRRFLIDCRWQPNLAVAMPARDGACLSIGSIAWSQALPCNNGDNNVGRFMRNVLDAFLRPGPLPGSEFVGEEKLWR